MNELVKQESGVFSPSTFDHSQRIASMLSKSDLVPKEYKDKPQNVLIAMELAARTGSSEIMVMQNVHIINGRPSWSSPFIISAINNSGRFSSLKFKLTKGELKESKATFWENKKPISKQVKYQEIECYAYATDNEGELIEGPPVSISMAIAEGWYSKTGSKWPNMPELMLRYRAASFFGRLYCPEILMGMKSTEEVQDMPETIETSFEEVKESPLAVVVDKVRKSESEVTPPPTPPDTDEEYV